MKTTRIYPLSQAANPPATVFVNGSRQEIDTIFSDSGQYFADLAWMIEREPHDRIASHERFQLAAIGIEKGKPFAPDAARQSAARRGRDGWASAIARANSFDSDDPARLVYPDRAWEWAFIGGSADWDSQGYVNTDRRASFAYIAIGMSPAMVEKHVGTGSQYLWTPRDGSGAFLDGGKRYRLHIPPNIPAKNFWSVVAYDADSRSILRSSQPFPSVSTLHGPGRQMPTARSTSTSAPNRPPAPRAQARTGSRRCPAKAGSCSSASTVRSSRSSTRRGNQTTSSRSSKPRPLHEDGGLSLLPTSAPQS